MTTIEKIRAEIERFYDGEAPKHDQQCDWEDGYFVGLSTVLNILDTLEAEEQQEVDLKKEIKEWTDLMVGASFPEQDGDFISEEDYRSVIRQTAIHFLGLNSKK